MIREKKFSLCDGKLPADAVDKVMVENKAYISLGEYSSEHDCGKFHGKTAKDRNNLLDYLEENEFFGIEIITPKELLIGNEKDILLFRRSDVIFLDKKLQIFFREYGLTEEKKIRVLLKNSEKTDTSEYLRKYLSEAFFEKAATPSVRRFSLSGRLLSMQEPVMIPDVHI